MVNAKVNAKVFVKVIAKVMAKATAKAKSVPKPERIAATADGPPPPCPNGYLCSSKYFYKIIIFYAIKIDI